MATKVRRRFVFKGRVQGVGFRPMAYNLAKKLGLVGIVLNTPEGVIVEVEGEDGTIGRFLEIIKSKQPPNSKIFKVDAANLPTIGYMSFRIMPSVNSGKKTVLISPDIGTCKECEKELFNPKDRRFGYPFINCTHCGPRFSIIKDIPYDRSKTSMAPFHMCGLCEFEYSDASNRRFHAEPNACEDCGPHLFLLNSLGQKIETLDPILKAVQHLKEGKIVAVKGIGGYHIMCDASNPAAIAELRKRKHRPHKPFAIMSYSLKEIKSYARVNEKESELLQSSARPIVLLKKRKGILIADNIAPANNTVGAMMPNAPIHYLLLKENFIALVATSANRPGEPIIKNNEKAVFGLKGIADFFLVNDRKITNRCDDSVMRAVKNKAVFIRRSKGFAPDPVRISEETLPEIIGLGGQKKNTIAIARGKSVYISQHIGELDNNETFSFFKESINKLEQLIKVKPKIVAHDMHPDYISSKYAKALHGVNRIAVQHHQAHIASVMAEHHLTGDVIGVAFDGTGFGNDGTVWGGEIFTGRPGNFERKGHLRPVPMPGGEAAIREPYKMAFSYLYDTYGEEAIKQKIDFVKRNRKEFEKLKRIIKSGINTPFTSSVGRLFDAVSALIGIRDSVTYEGQAAIELESIAQGKGYKSYDIEIDENYIINTKAIITGVVEDLKAGVSRDSISYKFHNTMGKIVGKICKMISKETKIKKVCLSGGVFQNALFLEAVIRELKKMRLEIFMNEKVPSNDGGISLGQVRIAKDMLATK